MLLFHFLAVILVNQLHAKKYIKCKACSTKLATASTTFNDWSSNSDVEETGKKVQSECDNPENTKSIKCDRAAGCLMIKDKENNIFNYGCVKEWDQEKKKGKPIEDSESYGQKTKNALLSFDECKTKNRKSGGCNMPGFKSFDVSNLLTGSISSERDKFVNNLFECGENFCYICDNGDDCNYSKDIRDAYFQKWYKDKEESEKVATSTTAETTETTTTLASEISGQNSTAPVPFASLTTISIALIPFFLP